MVICIMDKRRNCYYVLGSNGTDTVSKKNKKRNNFGNRFRIAAEDTKARFSHNSFESSMLQIHCDDFEKFMERLIN